MNHWTIGDGELRRQAIVQAGRYDELRRRSDEVRLLEGAQSPQPALGEHLRSWLTAALSRRGRARTVGGLGDAELEHQHG